MPPKPYAASGRCGGDELTVACATRLEYLAARRALPGTRVIRTGIGLARARERLGDAVISCGLAGGVRHEFETGTMVVPRSVLRPDGTTMTCDPRLSDALHCAAAELGVQVIDDPIVTTVHVVTGEERARWAERGFVAVDMETGLIAAPRVAAVRVLLDTPLRELSEEWLHPVAALVKPWLWPEALWLARCAPRCARLAAAVVGRALAGC